MPRLLCSSICTTLFCFLFFQPIAILAQPEEHGCHFRHNHIPLHALTAAEMAEMEMSNERSDTLDILDYEISLQVIDYAARLIDGHCDIRFTPKMDGVNHISLDLLELEIDAVLLGLDSLNYSYDGLRLDINFATLNIGDTSLIRILYHGSPVVDPTGFGGFDFNSGYAYNLGIGLGSNPYNYGRGWFPCFDNFRERSTFGFNITTANGRRAYCSGTFLGEQTIAGDTIMRSYRLDQQIPTYLAGVAVSNYREVNGLHQGLDRMIPTQLLARGSDTSSMKASFGELSDCIDVLEFWYGPYAWERVGFVTTVQGAMEHATNIAYPASAGLGGLDFGQNRLMTHELCHHWWGNVVNHDTPADMWIKEGNAEYGAYLFTEYTRGKAPFLKQVRDNHFRVLTEAHIDDEGYWPLSGIPFEQTYGTHTYYKGADMIHNMRSYLGDSLFRIGQQAVLNDFAFSSKDAAQYRDKLTEATGVDMGPFFNDWIFNPGFVAYEIDSVQVQPSGNDYEVTVYIEQKRQSAPNFHTQTPLEVTFIGADWQKEIRRVMASGPQSVAQVTLPFEPKIQFLNEDQNLSLAQWSAQQVITDDFTYGFPFAEFQVRVDEIQDSAYINVDHFWVAADDFADEEVEARISSRHYWRVSGILPNVFSAGATIEYNGRGDAFHDEDLVSMTEDSIILVYRANPAEDWQEYPFYTIINLIPTDQTGIVRIDSLLMGDFAFANGSVSLPVATKDLVETSPISVYPNPSNGQVLIEAPLDVEGAISIAVTDVLGQIIYEGQRQSTGGNLKEQLDIQPPADGFYLLSIRNEAGDLIANGKLQLIR